jgi:predicted AAA+ superfamily ATPase
VREALDDMPIVVLQGARQVGKSTLMAMIAQESHAVTLTLDDPDTLLIAQEDPRAIVAAHPAGLLAIDEAQRAPELILPLKASVDARRRPGSYLLTGSADLLHVKGVGDSLAGRAERIELLPLSQGEIRGRSTPEDFVTWLAGSPVSFRADALDVNDVLRGGYPAIHSRSLQRRLRWFRDYVERLSQHDAKELAGGGYSKHLHELLRYTGALGSAEYVRRGLARHLGVAESTVDAYWRTALTMCLIVEIPAWNRIPHRRLIKKPKAFLVDTGLSAALSGATPASIMHPGGREYYGSLVEQFVALELRKQQVWTSTPFDLFHFRESDGLEVDIVVETFDGKLIAIEVKSTTTPTKAHWRNLERFKDRYPERDVTGVLLHTGSGRSMQLHDWLHVTPITTLWQH